MKTSLALFVAVTFCCLVNGQSTSHTPQLRPIQQDGKWGYIDSAGKIVIKPQFSWAEESSEGLAAFENEDGKHGYIDETGKVVIDPKDDILNGTFSEGVGTVQFITDHGVNAVLIDRTGKVIVSVQEIETGGFSEGLAPAKKNGKWGYIDTSGRFAIEPQFEEAHAFSERLAAVLIGEKWGFINHQGKILIKPRFDYGPTEFSEGVAVASINNDCGLLDKTGKVQVRVRCTNAEEFRGGLSAIQIGEGAAEERGCINKHGKFVWGPVAFKYKSMEEISARAEKEAKDEEVLAPLTEEERALNPRDVILNQPDFVADLNFFVGEGFGGFGGAERLARKGNRYREESQFWIFVGELGKPSARVFPQAKAYDDFESARGGSADSTPINPAALAVENDVTFTMLGTRVIEVRW